MKVVRYLVLVSLAVGGIVMTIEGALIGLWRVWFNDEAPLIFQLMLPGLILALCVAAWLTAINGRRTPIDAARMNGAAESARDRNHAGLQ